MGNVVFVIHRPARQVLAAGIRTVVLGADAGLLQLIADLEARVAAIEEGQPAIPANGLTDDNGQVLTDSNGQTLTLGD